MSLDVGLEASQEELATLPDIRIDVPDVLGTLAWAFFCVQQPLAGMGSLRRGLGTLSFTRKPESTTYEHWRPHWEGAML